MKKSLFILTILFSFNVFAQTQSNTSLHDFTNLIQNEANNTKHIIQNFTKKYDMQCDKITTGFIRCDQYIGEEPFPYFMLFQNNEGQAIAYVSESKLPLKEGAKAPQCKDAEDYPKICYLPAATAKEKNQLYKYYIKMMHSAS